MSTLITSTYKYISSAAIGLTLFSTPLSYGAESSVATAPTGTVSAESDTIAAPSHRIDLGISTSFRATQGSFDPYGYYVPYPNGSSSWSVSENLKGAYHFSKDWDMSMTIPIRKTETDLPSGSKSSDSVGFPQISAHHRIGGPANLSLNAGVNFPWKWSASKTEGTPAASISGDSATDTPPAGVSTSFGIGSVQHLGRFRLSGDASTTYAFASVPENRGGDGVVANPNVSVRPGMRFQLHEGLAYLLNQHWNVSGGLSQMWLQSTVANGVVSDGTAGRIFSSSLGVSYTPDTIWRWGLGYETQFPFYSYIVNQPFAPAVSLSLTYAGM